MSQASAAPGALRGGPRLLERLEGLAMMAMALAFVWFATVPPFNGNLFALLLLFFAPDLSLLAYLAGPRIGAIVYNAAHTYITPFALAAVSFKLLALPAFSFAILWIAHIGFDRALGYGLKYASGFSDTHLGVIGGASKRSE
ncbi:MAG: DUF4260 family protein [Hyphomicrobiales bacterium]|nr:DUF4260 family protein [Hyphomicrobiales bacterium]